MQASAESIKMSIRRDLKFVNISNDKISLVEWKAPGSFKSYILDMTTIRENKVNDVFFQINKGNMKILYVRKSNVIFVIGALNGIQYQILETLLECVIERFHDRNDILSKLSIKNITSDAFTSFKYDIEDIIEKFGDSDLVKTVDVQCKVCKKVFPLVIKKSFIEKSTNFPVHVACVHFGHAIIVYIDKNFKVRGTGPINFAGEVLL